MEVSEKWFCRHFHLCLIVRERMVPLEILVLQGNRDHLVLKDPREILDHLVFKEKR